MPRPAIVFVNAQPRAGKDTLADALVDSMGFIKMRQAEPIRRALAGFFDLPISTIDEIVDNHKGKSLESLYGAEIRDLMIDFSENWAKKKMGTTIFGRLFTRKLDRFITMNKSVVVADAGFDHETDPVVKAFQDRACILLVRLFRGPVEMEKWDSRHRLDPKRWGIDSIDIHNDGTRQDMQSEAVRRVRNWYELKLSSYVDGDR